MAAPMRLSSISSQDSGFTSQDTLFLRPGCPTSQRQYFFNEFLGVDIHVLAWIFNPGCGCPRPGVLYLITLWGGAQQNLLNAVQIQQPGQFVGWVLEGEQEEALRQDGMVISKAASILPLCVTGTQDPKYKSATIFVPSSVSGLP